MFTFIAAQSLLEPSKPNAGGQKIVAYRRANFAMNVSRRGATSSKSVRCATELFKSPLSSCFAPDSRQSVITFCRQCRKRERRYDIARRARHQTCTVKPSCLQAAHQFRGFVRRYPASNAKRNTHGSPRATYALVAVLGSVRAV